MLSSHLKFPNELESSLQLFSRLPVTVRHAYLVAILKQCDPLDMRFLNKTIPTLHRDFLSLPNEATFAIMGYISPADISTMACVCRKWFKAIKNPSLWYALYKGIGLSSMAPVFHLADGSPRDNGQRFQSLGNWAHVITTYPGNISYAQARAALCIDYVYRFRRQACFDRQRRQVCEISVYSHRHCNPHTNWP